jgi:hypothetical protein
MLLLLGPLGSSHRIDAAVSLFMFSPFECGLSERLGKAKRRFYLFGHPENPDK